MATLTTRPIPAGAEIKVNKPDVKWSELVFGYHKTDFNIRYTFRNGQWDQGVLSSEETLPLHIACTGLHYGQQCFEGLKAFESARGEVLIFRPDENAKRMIHSCRKVLMEPPPAELFIDAVDRVVAANRRFVPPYGSGASLYIRPLTIGISAQVGVRPASDYLFLVFVTPVGPYFKEGFHPVHLVVEEHVDRAAPLGVGDAKVGGNYAAGLRATVGAKKRGFTEVLYLDAKQKRFIDESGPANFFAITRDGEYVTPQSESILASITNMSLITLAEEIGLKAVRRPIAVDELPDFVEAGCCGTAAVISPIGSITWRDRKIIYSRDGAPGPVCTQLYQRLRAIQLGDAPDTHGWNHRLPDADRA